ncbi:MAG: N-6 DNA methylase [Candidatus Hodarchaeota archaeon]
MFAKSATHKAIIQDLKSQFASAREKYPEAFDKTLQGWLEVETGIHGITALDINILVAELYFMTINFLLYAIKKQHLETVEADIAYLDDEANVLWYLLYENHESFRPYLDLLKFTINAHAENIDTDFKPIFTRLIDDLTFEAIKEYITNVKDLFSSLYQVIFTRSRKHASGEHYTPIDLCDVMLLGTNLKSTSIVLDPTCGTGAFLVALIHYMKTVFPDSGDSWIEGIHGRDINPLAIMAARINAWNANDDVHMGIEFFFQTIKIEDINFYKDDKSEKNKYDLIIGNPPWVTLKDLATEEQKTQLLANAKKLRIAPDAHNVPQLELATVVFSSCLELHLKAGGMIFFIMTSAFMNGKHCNKFRQLNGLKDVEIWLFEGHSMFPKEFACLKGIKAEKPRSFFLDNDKIKSLTWGLSKKKNKDGTISLDFKQLKDSFLQPVNISALKFMDDKKGGENVLKFIPESEMKNIIESRFHSSYKKLCYNGATIFPQSFLFIRILHKNVNLNKNLVEITTDLNLKMKSPWNFFPYEKSVVETRYIYDIVKGSELYPFGFHEPQKVFLPIVQGESSFVFDQEHFDASGEEEVEDPARATAHYRILNYKYKEIGKTSGRINNLWERLNFDSALTNPAMQKPFKVIFPDCGSVMAAAIVKGNTIIEHALHYIGLDNKDEAYYMLGILNAPCVQRDIKIKKAERHIGQMVLNYSIPIYDPMDRVHTKIAQIAMQIELLSKEVAEKYTRGLKYKKMGYFQCIGCLKFANTEKLSSHKETCKKYKRLAKLLKEKNLFIEVTEKTLNKIKLIPTRNKIKQELLYNRKISELMVKLDKLVLQLIAA